MYQDDGAGRESLSIPLSEGQKLEVPLQTGKPLFVVGPNGSGKSELLHRFYGSFPRGRICYMPGSRPNYFQSESRSLTPSTTDIMQTQFQTWNSQPIGRWTSNLGPQWNEVAIYTLQTLETDYKLSAVDDIAHYGKDSKQIERLQRHESPLDRLNLVLTQSNLKVRLKVMNADLVVERQNSTYSIAKMSDGERAALLLAAQVMSAPTASIFVIDEPEPYLHESIVVPLITSLVSIRNDCLFIVGTHKLDLPTRIESDILLVRDSVWSGEGVVYWDVDLVTSQAGLPEEIIAQIIGSRRKILFIEGIRDSLDQPLYALLFPNISVIASEGCQQVLRAVLGLRSSSKDHRVDAYGLIDNDGMSESRIAELKQQHVFALPLYSVESLYYSKIVRDAICTRQAQTLGLTAETLNSDAKVAGLAELKLPETQQHLAAHASYMRMRDSLVTSAPSKKEIIKGESSFAITLPSVYPTALRCLREFVDREELDAIIARYPVRESSILISMAKAMRFRSRSDYESAVLAALASDHELKDQVLASLEPLTGLLQ